MKRFLLLLVSFPIALSCIFAQASIETRLCYADTTAFEFTSEWQYLSTDVYLFNGEQLSKVINELTFAKIGSQKKGFLGSKKGLAEEKLESLFITAQVENVKFFGEKEIVYPLYNFQINTDKENKYKTYVSDNIQHIRIIDNLPLYSASDQIDAKINVRAITQNDRDQIFGFIGLQLQAIAKDASPVGAVFSLINELGSFMESSSRKKEYQFSSTIRLFEQKNFDTRLHSIRIYQLVASNRIPTMPDTKGIKQLLSKADVTELTRKQLEEAMSYHDYPYLVVANYKSLYRMEEIKGDEVSMASIDKRKFRVESSYKNGLISEDTYKQEKDFIGYLAVFAGLKTTLELYNMNFKMGNIDAASNSLATIAQQYRQLVQLYEEAEFKYKDNNTFKNIFRNEYSSITDYADLYLDADHNLKAVKSMIKAMATIEKEGMAKELLVVEELLRMLLYAEQLKADFMTQTQTGQIIARQIKLAEQLVLERYFAQDILKLSQANAIPANLGMVDDLKEKVAKTSCGTCRTQALEVIKDFYGRYDSYQRTDVLKNTEDLKKAAELRLFEYLDNSSTAELNIQQLRSSDSTSIAIELLYIKVEDLKKEVLQLGELMKVKLADKSLSIINTYNEKLSWLLASIEEKIGFLKSQKPELLIKPSPEPDIKEGPTETSNQDRVQQN